MTRRAVFIVLAFALFGAAAIGFMACKEKCSGFYARYFLLPDSPRTVTPASHSPGNYDKGLVVEAFSGTDLSGNLFYSGTFDQDLSTDFAFLNAKEFSVRFKGYLYFSQPGNYRIKVTSDDGARVYMADTLLVDTWGRHKSFDSVASFTLTDVGCVPVVLEYQNLGEVAIFSMAVERETQQYALVTGARLFHDKMIPNSSQSLKITEHGSVLDGVSSDSLRQSADGFHVAIYDSPELTAQPIQEFVSTGALELRGQDVVTTPGMFWARMTGWVLFEEAGDYCLELKSDGDCILRLNEALVFDNSGLSRTVSRNARLHIGESGYIPFSLEYHNLRPSSSVRVRTARMDGSISWRDSLAIKTGDLKERQESSGTLLSAAYAVPSSNSPGLSMLLFDDADLGGSARSSSLWKGAFSGPLRVYDNQNVGLLFKGYFHARKSGQMRLRLTSDDGSRLMLGEHIAIRNWGSHAQQSVETAFYVESPGYYPISVEYQNLWGGAFLRLEQSIDDEEWEILGEDDFRAMSPVDERRPFAFVSDAPTTMIATKVFPGSRIDRLYQLMNCVYGEWNYRAVPKPKSSPRLLVDLTARFRAKTDGLYTFRVDSPYLNEFAVDDKLSLGQHTVQLTKGYHAIAIRLAVPETTLEDAASDRVRALDVRYLAPGSSDFVNIPASLLSPNPLRFSFLQYWPCLALLGIVLCALGYQGGAFRKILSRRAMFLSTLLFVMALGASARLLYLDKFPPLGENNDEFQELWVGRSLIKSGRPTSWVWWHHDFLYTDKQPFQLFGTHFMVSPSYLDHPPLYGVLTHLLTSQPPGHQFFEVNVLNGRRLNVALFCLNILFMFFIGRHMRLGTLALLLAGLTYGLFPVILFTSCIVKCDQLLVTVVLAACSLCLSYLRYSSHVKIGGLCVLVIIGIWSKETGIFLPALLVAVLARKRRILPAVIVAGSAVLGIGSYLCYGYWVNADVFKGILKANSSRMVSWEVMLVLWNNFKISYITMYPTIGMSILLWVAFFATSHRRVAAIAIAVAIYLMVLMSSIDTRFTYGQYSLVLYPFLALLLGDFLVTGFMRQDVGRYFLLLAFGVMMPLCALLPDQTIERSYVLKMTVAVAWLPVVSYLCWPKKRWSSIASQYAYATMLVVMIVNCILLAGTAAKWY